MSRLCAGDVRAYTDAVGAHVIQQLDAHVTRCAGDPADTVARVPVLGATAPDRDGATNRNEGRRPRAPRRRVLVPTRVDGRTTLPMFAQAAFWGLLAGSGLLVGAAVAVAFERRLSHRAIAAVMGFGGGVLVAVLSIDLMESAFRDGGPRVPCAG